ncbi:16839_t:CDS:1, partial [Gigaspora rosea]
NNKNHTIEPYSSKDISNTEVSISTESSHNSDTRGLATTSNLEDIISEDFFNHNEDDGGFSDDDDE